MDHKIRKLLDKKKITGKEFGRAYITTRLWDNITNGKDIILTDQELKILATKVVERLEIDIGNAYVNFYNWLDRSHLIAKKYYESFYVGFSRLYIKLHFTIESEEGLNTLKRMTESLSKIDNNYQQLKTFTENILFNMSVFHQVADKESLEFMQSGRDTVKVGLSNILSYNKAINLFTDFFKMPEISEAFEIETEKLFTAINMLNNRIVLLRNFLYGSKNEVIKKSRILDDIYPIIDIPAFEPKQEDVKKASKSLKKNILSYNPYEIMKILQGNYD